MKRGFESQDSFESSPSTSTLPSIRTQRSDVSSLSEAQDQLSYSDRGWNSVYPELTGLNLSNDNDFQLELDPSLQSNDTFSLADIGGANIESWMSQELTEDVRDDEPARSDSPHSALSDKDLTCYGMVSNDLQTSCQI